MATVSVSLDRAHFRTRVTAGKHVIIADEPPEEEGTDQGMDPFELLLASVGSCTAITMRMYADRKAWPLDSIRIRLTLEQEQHKTVARIKKFISLSGALTPEQRSRLLYIAEKCPTHQLMTHDVIITSELREIAPEDNTTEG